MTGLSGRAIKSDDANFVVIDAGEASMLVFDAIEV
jgi:hypothetical protein